MLLTVRWIRLGLVDTLLDNAIATVTGLIGENTLKRFVGESIAPIKNLASGTLSKVLDGALMLGNSVSAALEAGASKIQDTTAALNKQLTTQIRTAITNAVNPQVARSKFELQKLLDRGKNELTSSDCPDTN